AKGVTLLFNHTDIADIAIDNLRRWQRWELTDQVIDLFDKLPADSSSVIQRSIVKFALRSPEPRAKAFVEDQRKKDKEWVQDIEELLESEDPSGRSKTDKTDKSSPPSRSESSMLYWGAGILAALALAAVPGRRLLAKGK